jgi:hypothetical protein
MLNYEVLLSIAEAVVKRVPSPFIFHNSKTIVSIDFGVCSLMNKNKAGKYSSKVCKGCYAANLLNIYPGLRSKMEDLPSTSEPGQLEKFEESLKMLKAYIPGLNRLRFYAFADFRADHVPFIKMAAKYFEVDIISKALSFPQNEGHLRELLGTENVWISLSFNRDYMQHFDRIVKIVEDADRVTLNYTLNYVEENPDTLPFRHLISVWHLKNDRKRYIIEKGEFRTLAETNVCGVFDGEGNRNTWGIKKGKNGNRIKEGKGSCHACNNCRCSLKMLLAGKVSDLPNAISA